MKILKSSMLPIKIVPALLSIMFLLSCSRSSDSVDQSVNNSSDAALNYFGKTLAKAISNEQALRAFLKGEAIKQVDGDYDIFYQSNKSKMIKGGKTLHEILIAYSEDSRTFEEIVNKNLDINIKIPVVDGTGAEEWNTVNFIPLTAIRDKSITKEQSKEYIAYNGEGQITKIPAAYDQAPKQVTVIVELSERIHIESLSTLERDMAACVAKYKNNLSDQKQISSVSTQSQNKNLRRAGCDRDQYSNIRQRLRSVTIKSTSWDRVIQGQDWGDGFLEIHGKFIYAASTDATQFSTQEAVVTGRIGTGRIYNSDCDNPIWVFKPDEAFGANYDLVKWDKNKSGDTWKVVFFEKDGGFEVKSTVSFTTGFEFSFTDPITGKLTASKTSSTEITRQDQDDSLGEMFLYYCDALRSDYDYSDMKFSIGVETDSPFRGPGVGCTTRPPGPR